jgi:predicted nucleotide-binding protein
MAVKTENVEPYPKQVFETLRHFAEIIFSELGLSVAEIEKQSLPDLELSLATVRSAILRPESFGTIRMALHAEAGISVVLVNNKAESHLEMTILPILLERERLILKRIQALEEIHRLQDLKDVVNLIKDQDVRAKMEGNLHALREKAARYDKEIQTKRPMMFLGSSTEGLPIAEAIQINLEHNCDCEIWSQGVFGLGEGTLESLVRVVGTYDFAALVLTPDDLVSKRDNKGRQPRDNVLFELGLFMGRLGRDKAFIVHPRNTDLELPTDLAGITAATFVQRDGGNLRAALGPVCTLLKAAMKAKRA